MADLALVTANRFNVVESFEQMTLPCDEAITAGQAVRLNTSTGKFTKANATTAAESAVYGIATKTTAANMPVTAIRHGVVTGHDLSGLGGFWSPVYLSDTDGALADAAGTLDLVIGRVISTSGVTIGTAYDRLLMVDFSGALAGGAGTPTQIPITYRMNANGSLADESFFIADRPYIVDSIREKHAVAGSDASAVNLQVTIDTGTAAPGAGTDLLTNNSNAGFDMKGTANTVQTGTLVAVGSRTMATGDRLSVDFAGTLTALAGVVVTVMLTPA